MLAYIKNGTLTIKPCDSTEKYAMNVFKVAFQNGSGSIGIEPDDGGVDIIVTAEKKPTK